jgi:uncharacterized membrane protein YeaQ/YmgE (transglycosylase-associated protein family)
LLGAIIQVLISGFVIGALARWAVPGPDPMSVPLTILLGVFGSFLGGGIAAAFVGTDQTSGDVFAILIGSVVASMVILVLYRRYVQHRPITGPKAQQAPRERPQLGTLLGRPGRGAPQASPRSDVSEQLQKLAELRDEGVLSDEEFEAKKAELLARS